jgi:hypothetical protein
MNNNTNPSEKYEIIEQALQESVGGGRINLCAITCHVFSIDVCRIDVCGILAQ